MYARSNSIMKLIDRGHNLLKAVLENNIHIWKIFFPEDHAIFAYDKLINVYLTFSCG